LEEPAAVYDEVADAIDDYQTLVRLYQQHRDKEKVECHQYHGRIEKAPLEEQNLFVLIDE